MCDVAGYETLPQSMAITSINNPMPKHQYNHVSPIQITPQLQYPQIYILLDLLLSLMEVLLSFLF